MSLWGATVITNLISAIPWIGQDIVESKIITINIYLGIFIVFSFLIAVYNSLSLLLIKVSDNEALLPTIGVVHKNALKKGNKTLRLDKQEYNSIPSSFLAFLVGLIDGDGYIQISKTTKGFITMKMVISLHLDDISTLEYIYSVLKIGKINIYKDLRSPTCKLVINKTDLQEVLFPLLVHNKIYFLTDTRVNQFNLAMYILMNDIKDYNLIGDINNIPAIFEIPKNPFDYTLLHFFKNWIVGFTCPWLYPGLVQFVQENPLTYKRVKKEYKNLVSRREGFNYLKQTIKQQEKVRRYSTYAVKPNNTDLVVWGSNLSSTVGTGRNTKIVKNMIVLPSYQKSVLVGLLLSDGYLASAKSHENPHLAFKQSLKNSRYVLFVFSILSHYCNLYPTVVKSIRNNNINLALFFRTRGLPCFFELRSLFYINKVKIVPSDIYNLLTPVALAHLIMGDGSAKQHGLILCTDSFELVDVVRLMNVLMIRYNVDCTLRFHTQTQPRIYIRQRSMPIIRELVKSYMDKSMLYKIGL